MNTQINPAALCLEADVIDTSAFDEQLVRQKPLQEAFGGDFSQTVLGAELFTSLYRLFPHIREDPPAPARARLLDAMMKTSAYHKLHALTALDEVLSAAATLEIKRLLEEELSEDFKQALEEEAQAQQLLEELAALADTLDDESRAQLEAQAQQALEHAQALAQEADELKSCAASALNSTLDRLSSALAYASAWGTDDGTLKRVLFNQSLACLFKKDKLKRILELAGRMRQIMSRERAARPEPSIVVSRVRAGNNIEAALASELALLSDNELSDAFYLKYIERALLELERSERLRRTQGPFVICIDESSSMAGAKEEFAKAFALALAAQARKERRGFGFIAFSSKNQVRAVWNPSPEGFVDQINQFWNGGTDFEAPLEAALDMIERSEPRADVVFITDGEAEVSSEFLKNYRKRKYALDVRVLGVQVGYYDAKTLKELCDVTFRISALSADSAEILIKELR